MQGIDYRQASDIDHALRLATEHGDNGIFIAGGQSLVNMLKNRLLPEGQTVIDISDLESLAYVEEREDAVAIGALTTHSDLVESEVLEDHFPALVEMVAQVGDVQVRNVGTIGGDLAQADPQADYPVFATAAEASVTVRSSDGERSYPAEDFFTGYFETALESGELLTEVSLPMTPPGTTIGFRKFAERKGDFPLLNAAVKVSTEEGRCTDVRIRIGCVSGTPVSPRKTEEYVIGRSLSELDPATVGARAATEIDHFGGEVSAEYSARLTETMVARATTDCIERVDAK